MFLRGSGIPEARQGAASIAARQQADGGWGYGLASWTEPTALALLAVSTRPEENALSVRAGVEWLRRARRPEGGWPPNPRVDQSVTWATALALLALTQATGEPSTPSVRWLLDTSGKESGVWFRVQRWLWGGGNGDREGFEGWPWYPGTAGWVAPTGIAICALEKTLALQAADVGQRVGERIQLGRDFLVARRCLDGGWNHGASRALGHEAGSYPETTGVALLGLTGVPRKGLERSLQRAAEEYSECRSAQGRAWLRLALVAYGQPVPSGEKEAASRDITDTALEVLASAATQGRNVFTP